jgi:hypothetical protein
MSWSSTSNARIVSWSWGRDGKPQNRSLPDRRVDRAFSASTCHAVAERKAEMTGLRGVCGSTGSNPQPFAGDDQFEHVVVAAGRKGDARHPGVGRWFAHGCVPVEQPPRVPGFAGSG